MHPPRKRVQENLRDTFTKYCTRNCIVIISELPTSFLFLLKPMIYEYWAASASCRYLNWRDSVYWHRILIAFRIQKSKDRLALFFDVDVGCTYRLHCVAEGGSLGCLCHPISFWHTVRANRWWLKEKGCGWNGKPNPISNLFLTNKAAATEAAYQVAAEAESEANRRGLREGEVSQRDTLYSATISKRRGRDIDQQ